MRPDFTLWTPPPAQPALSPGEIHLWRADLDRTVPQEALLSADERERTARLLLPEKKRSFAAGRTLLRQILGLYLAAPPESLRFAYNLHGKPLLTGVCLDFSLAHSGGLFLLAVGTGGALGIDAEQIDPRLDWQSVAQRFFPAIESQALAALPPHRQRRAFYRLWTRKEACLKGMGCGFSAPAPLDDSWHVHLLPLGPGALGALATATPLKKIRRFSLHDSSL